MRETSWYVDPRDQRELDRKIAASKVTVNGVVIDKADVEYWVERGILPDEKKDDPKALAALVSANFAGYVLLVQQGIRERDAKQQSVEQAASRGDVEIKLMASPALRRGLERRGYLASANNMKPNELAHAVSVALARELRLEQHEMPTPYPIVVLGPAAGAAPTKGGLVVHAGDGLRTGPWGRGR